MATSSSMISSKTRITKSKPFCSVIRETIPMRGVSTGTVSPSSR